MPNTSHYVAFLTVVIFACLPINAAIADTARFVRYTDGESQSYGQRDGDVIHELDKAPWNGGRRTGRSVNVSDIKMLAPAEPSKVFAVGFNYDSHRGDQVLPAHPPIFLKLPSTITGPGADIIYPAGASNVHFEGELVVVIGKTASRVSAESAGEYIFGVTAGNDVSERDWQANDLQWFRGKASDTFGPIGPEIVTGLNYRDLLLQTRLNGKVVQEQRTRDHIHDVHAIVSFISQYATLYPGDVIFTGTPGQTSAMVPGDVIEIEIENVGVLRNAIGKPIK
ncbi:MAG: fumarylacetoacetate hydrolase family protein [Gammaproteobacteria bacterium]|nr:fumarylacetoacetate hydrolase family protein [Gammaproteobacteria bacterium]MDH4313390.1 fumarylacetoacetate hydrolase family protein [Gammaproteobacteria bacterium]MDH5214232.1 fumarylacetoacetate hydrolase family protein [Gammaproteobacteria bacterium]MDH5501058.1 fumarylacetoacetate hydrolase family protein [Gammaproteobacteria bacterium]